MPNSNKTPLRVPPTPPLNNTEKLAIATVGFAVACKLREALSVVTDANLLLRRAYEAIPLSGAATDNTRAGLNGIIGSILRVTSDAREMQGHIDDDNTGG